MSVDEETEEADVDLLESVESLPCPRPRLAFFAPSRFRFLTRHTIALSRLHTHPLALSQKTCQRKMDILQPSSPLRRKYIYLVHSLDLSSYLVDIEATSTSFLSSRPERVATSRPLPVPLSLFVTTEGPWTSSLSNPNRGPATHTKGREKGKGQDGARVYDNTPAGIKHNIASCSSWLVSIVLSSPCPHLLRW
jgi:hypothetical protein